MQAFTSVQAVKQLLGLTVRTQDGQLEILVNGVNQAFKTYLNRDIFTAQYTETRNGTGTNAILFANTPVTAVSSIRIGAPNVTRRTLVENVDYVWSDLMAQMLTGVFCRGVANVVLSYTAGFAAAPADLAEKATKVAATRFKELDRLGQLSKSIGAETVSFDAKAWPNDVKDILQSYMKRVPV